jgi:hypothetical protein
MPTACVFTAERAFLTAEGGRFGAAGSLGN